MTDLTMSQFASKDDLLAAQAARIAELESQLEAIGAGGVEPLRKPAAAPQAVQAAVPDNWRDQFSGAVYEDLSAADNQDVPLEEYPARILNILDAIVGPRHPTVIKWRNDAIRSCIAIAYKYCSDPESYRYLKQDLEVMLAATQPAAQGMDALAESVREAFAKTCDAAEAQAKETGESAKQKGDFASQLVAGGAASQAERLAIYFRGSEFAPALHAALAAQAKQGGAANG